MTPEWVKTSIFYQIFPDRFAKSDLLKKPGNLEAWDAPPTLHGFKGGDLLGVAEQLDYLQDLGITAIYFNPIFQSASNHRYHTHDYYRVDPLLGGNEAFLTLLEKAHNRGMRIILDGVFNHASRGFFQFNHILECGPSSPYIDWFTVEKHPPNAYSDRHYYKSWFNLPALPEFNTENQNVREFLFAIARHWLEVGIDGWRLDVPASIDDDEFWGEFRQIVKSVNPEAYIVGEITTEAQRWLQGDQFDGIMNYQLMQPCLGFFAAESINWNIEKGIMGLHRTMVLDAASFAKRVEELLKIYPKAAVYAQLNLLDSHDMPRFVTLAGGDKTAYKLAVLFLMTYPGAPCIYYGDEIGMQEGTSNYPEASRYAFNWNLEERDTDLRKYIKCLIHIRRNNASLSIGSFYTLYAQGQVLAYLREFMDDQFIVVINTSQSSQPLEIPVDIQMRAQSTWHDLLTNRTAQLSDGVLSGMTIPPRSGAIMSMQI